MSGNKERLLLTIVGCEKCGSKKFYNDMLPVEKKGFIFVDQDNKTSGIFSTSGIRSEALQDLEAHLSYPKMVWTCAGCNEAVYAHNSIKGQLLEKIVRVYLGIHSFVVYNDWIPPGFENALGL